MNRSRNRAGTDEMASLIQEDETMSPCFEGMTSTEAPDVDREVGPRMAPKWASDDGKNQPEMMVHFYWSRGLETIF